MTPTATYLASENCLQELPRMEKPRKPEEERYAGRYMSYLNALAKYSRDISAYNAHLATLRKIPCDPSCKGLWADQEKVVEGKDYEVHSICGFYKTDCGKRKHCEDCRLVALPLVPAGEDEFVWTDELVKEYAEQYRFSSSRISIEQFKYSLTKR